MAGKPLVYVSYAWRSRDPSGSDDDLLPGSSDREQIVDKLCHVLAQEDRIIVGRDKKLVKTGDSIADFADQIARSGLIIAVISHRSLRSDWCMKEELLHAFRCRRFDHEEFGQDVLALILDDAMPDIENNKQLLTCWSVRLQAKLEELQLADPERKYSPKSWQDADAIAELLGRLPDLLRALRIRAMPRGAEAISEAGFHEIRNLVKQRLQEKTGWAAAISPSRLGPVPGQQIPTPKPSEKQVHFLALVLEPSSRASGEIAETLFGWQAYIKPPSQSHYEPCILQAENSLTLLGESLRASSLATDGIGSPGREPSSLADLIQIAVDWIQAKPFGSACVLELFLPFELLDFAWSTLQVKDRRSRFSQIEELPSKIPFILRCWERFSDPYFTASLAALEEKYRVLVNGEGEWLAEDDACSLVQVRDAEKTHQQVAIKRLHPLEEDQQLRLQWLDAMQLSMVPVVLWRLHGRPECTEKELHDYLALYGAALNGHQHGDIVSHACAQFEDIAFNRKRFARDSLVHDIVFLMDHPGRAPAAAASASDLTSV